jgi:MFS family permease
LLLREKNYYSERVEKESINYLKTLFEAIKICINNSKILIGMILLVAVTGITGYSDEFDPLIINDFGLGYIWISIFFVTRFLFIALGERFASVAAKIIKSKNEVYLLSGLASVLFILFCVTWNQYVIVLFGISCMIMTMAEVIQVEIIQNEIEEEGRTTIMSIYGLFQNLAMILFCSVIAILSNAYNLRWTYIFISVFCFSGVIILFFISLGLKQLKTPEQTGQF